MRYKSSGLGTQCPIEERKFGPGRHMGSEYSSLILEHGTKRFSGTNFMF
jgi:hypothetical protein